MGKLLVTGGAGFIGSNYIRHALSGSRDLHIINLDKLTYAGNTANLGEFEDDGRYRFVHGDIADRQMINALFEQESFASVINFAAETHVDRSIREPEAFIESNIKGTQVLLDACNHFGIDRFVQISTDEVYGSLDPTTAPAQEDAPLQPNSPYSASKCAADLLCRAYHQTYNLPIVTVRSCNAYGPYQYPEKFIPLMIYRARANLSLPIYGDGLNIREWIHVEDLCQAIELIHQSGKLGQIYNIGTGYALENLQLAKNLLNLLERPETLIEFVRDRPGHDRRYAIDATKLRSELDWEPTIDIETGLSKTIDWYVANEAWTDSITSGAFQKYFEEVYAQSGDALHTRRQ